MTRLNRPHRILIRAATTMAVAVPLTVASPAAVAGPPSAGPPDAVVAWDLNAQTAIWDVAHQQPWEQGRSFAMVHGAVYDAVNAIAGRPYQPYLTAPPASGRESTAAAVAAAAYNVLVSLFPAQQTSLQARYVAALAAIPDGHAKVAGVAIGQRTATAMIAFRQDDGAFGSQQWLVGTQPGQWQPIPPPVPGFPTSEGAWVGHLKPFMIPRASAFATDGPPALNSDQYTKDFNEVKSVGSVNSISRTADQTDAARWWHDRHLYEWEVRRQLISTQHLNAVQAARLLAMASMVTTDAGIACFYEKETWSFWRPVTAIQLADTDGNPKTAADPSWQPLLFTPPFPEYTSGHACGTGSLMTTFALFFGRDDISFHATSTDTGTTRYFSRFSQALTELINARVWGGIHFRTSDNEGALIGTQTAVYMFTHYFQPRC